MYKKLLISFLIFIFGLSIAGPVYARQTQTYPIYVVQDGDTLSLIAQKFGISMEDLLAANTLANQNVLNIGTKLNIPDFPGISGMLEIKTMGVGETLNSFAQKYHVLPGQLATLNRITSPTALYAGSELIVPIAEDQKDFPNPVTLSDQSLLETAISSGSNPWSIPLNNQIEQAWDLIPGDGFFPVSKEGVQTSVSGNPIQEITIDPLPLVQGATEVIHIKTSRPLNLTADLSGQQIPFFKNADNDYYAFDGVHAFFSVVGLKNLTITSTDANEKKVLISQPILLVSGNFTQEVVEGVEASTIDPKAIALEDSILNTISTTSTQKLWDGLFKFPIDDPCMGSGFGNHRSYNDGAYLYYHTGLDFGICAQNLNIYAVAPGVVIYTGLLPTKGNYTLIDHGWGVYSGYAHQSQFKVQVGDHVDTHQLIGIIGQTGRVTGPHLHFEVWVNHIPVDPLPWLKRIFPK